MRNPWRGLLASLDKITVPRLGDISTFELLISKLRGWMGAVGFTARRPYHRQPGAGVARAAARLAAQRMRNEARVPPFLNSEVRTRQVVRRSMLLRGRQIMTKARREMAKRDLMGGPAVIRNAVDVGRYLD